MKRLSIVLALVLSFVTVAPVGASELPTAKPEQVGLSYPISLGTICSCGDAAL